jgi:DNA-binding PadR family transcriptional regulator
MSTRLLVLGIVRIFQPVHGYNVRRELETWRMDSWVSSKPGSVYSALRTLEKDGLIAEAVGDQSSGRRRAGGSQKTEYVITAEGEKEFGAMLREAWWTVQPSIEPLIPALSLVGFMSRRELIAALQARAGQIEGRIEQLRFFREMIPDGSTGACGEVPEHVREIVDFSAGKVRAELESTRSFIDRLEAGSYLFTDEAGWPGASPPPPLDDSNKD